MVKDTKVTDDNFYLLTLAAIAKELKTRGIYNVEGFGECRMNVNPQNQAFILIQTEDGCYIFSADKDEKTSEVYQQLKDDL